jgi:5-methylcytosine-specific restriction endonuclease McrA
MTDALIEAVRRRAGYACEYCRLPDHLQLAPFEVEHIVSRQHGGATTLANLAYACLHCNRHKGPNLASIDIDEGLFPSS